MPKLKIIISFYFLSTLISCTSTPPAEEAKELTEKFHLTMNQCPEKIWADYDWEMVKLFLVFSRKKTAFFWDGYSNELHPYDWEKIPLDSRESLFNFLGKVQAANFISFRLDRSSPDPIANFRLGIHEVFHFVGQEKWSSKNKEFRRGTPYPVDWQPRYYRAMLFTYLFAALKSNSTEALRFAKFWFEKWKSEFPIEYKNSTDRYEGTAEYADAMATAVLNLGCSTLDTQLKKEFISIVIPRIKGVLKAGASDLSTEGYYIGMTATAILRFSQVNLTWQKRISNGESPVDILLENVSPINDKDDLKLKGVVRKNSLKESNKVGLYLDKEIMQHRKKDYIRVAYNSEDGLSNFNPLFFAILKDIKKSSAAALSMNHDFISEKYGHKYTLPKGTVVFLSGTDNPCNHYYVLVHKNDFKDKGNRFEFSSKSIHGHFTGKMATNKSGFRYICAK